MSQAKAIRVSGEPCVTLMVPPLSPKPKCFSFGADGLMTATSNVAGGGGGRSFARSGELALGVSQALSTITAGSGALFGVTFKPSCLSASERVIQIGRAHV